MTAMMMTVITVVPAVDATSSKMKMSEKIKQMAVARAPEQEVAMSARQDGMLTLREDGIGKVRAGLTSLEEVLRVAWAPAEEAS